MSICVCRLNEQVIYHYTDERWSEASAVGDVEDVGGEAAKDPTGFIEEFDGLVTDVGNGHSDLQVLQSIDVDVRGRDLYRQARRSKWWSHARAH